ncbi:MAG TPA: ABC transporter permease subunit [Fimbriimonadaceae bacterium]|nr:ABC transporter permease subunit [Fimbriimonadaceae bacterium]
MTSFLILSTLRDFVRVRRLAIWIIIVIGLFGLAKAFLFVNPGQSPQDSYVQLSGLMVYRILALAAAIFSAAVVSQEIEQKTIVYLVTRPIPRPTILLCRYVATVIVVFAVGVCAAFSVSLATHGLGALGNEIFYRDLPALLMGSAAYSALFVWFSLLMNRSMLVNLLFAFGWETFIPNIPGDAYRLSIFTYIKAIAQRPSTGEVTSPLGFISGEAGPDLVSRTTGYATLFFLTALMIGLAAYWFRNFEYLPREDAE